MAHITGRTINNDHRKAPRRSCPPIDVPTDERVTVTIGGIEYERTVHERLIWRNSCRLALVARFVIVNGVRYEVAA